jgi:hypothetical protein
MTASPSLERFERELRQLAAFESQQSFLRSRLMSPRGSVMFRVTTEADEEVPLTLRFGGSGEVCVLQAAPDEAECAVVVRATADIMARILREEVNQRAVYDSGQLVVTKGSLIDLVQMRSMFARYGKARRRGKLPTGPEAA